MININNKKKLAFTLVELLVASFLALIVLLLISLSTIEINKYLKVISKKYTISNDCKLALVRIVNEISKNSNPDQDIYTILELTNNKISFLTTKISENPLSYDIYKVDITVSKFYQNKSVLFKLNKEVFWDFNKNNSYETSEEIETKQINLPVIKEVDNADLNFSKIGNMIRVSLTTSFTFRNKNYTLNYYIDIPVN
ncbi:MAG: prepilin-type N-terminal cleavage/methylation domain-containing protein [bacterium]|nr:prepilin-type N-terminal cleavage/methylation domain-containing protein [bacterium]